jgi:hypothetical protein
MLVYATMSHRSLLDVRQTTFFWFVALFHSVVEFVASGDIRLSWNWLDGFDNGLCSSVFRGAGSGI